MAGKIAVCILVNYNKVNQDNSPFQTREAPPFPAIPYRPVSIGKTFRRTGSEGNYPICPNYITAFRYHATIPCLTVTKLCVKIRTVITLFQSNESKTYMRGGDVVQFDLLTLYLQLLTPTKLKMEVHYGCFRI